MRLTTILKEQDTVKKKHKHAWNELFETTAIIYWDGIYKLHTLPLSESGYNHELTSLQRMIFETAVQLPLEMIPVFSKHIDDVILNEIKAGEMIDKGLNAFDKGKDALIQRGKNAAKAVGKAATKAGKAVAGGVSKLANKVSPGLSDRFVKYGKDVKDKILAQLTEIAGKITTKLKEVTDKVSKLFSKSCPKATATIADALDLSISEFNRLLVEAETPQTIDPTDVAGEIMSVDKDLPPMEQMAKAGATVWYRSNDSLSGGAVLDIATFIGSQSKDVELQNAARTDKILDYIESNKLVDKMKGYDKTKLDYGAVEAITPNTLSPEECAAFNDSTLVGKLLATVDKDSTYQKALQDFGVKHEEVIGKFNAAFKGEKANIVIGILTTVLTVATGPVVGLNLIIVLGSTLVPALIRALGNYFNGQGMPNAAKACERVARIVSVLVTVLQAFNFLKVVGKLIGNAAAATTMAVDKIGGEAAQAGVQAKAGATQAGIQAKSEAAAALQAKAKLITDAAAAAGLNPADQGFFAQAVKNLNLNPVQQKEMLHLISNKHVSAQTMATLKDQVNIDTVMKILEPPYGKVLSPEITELAGITARRAKAAADLAAGAGAAKVTPTVDPAVTAATKAEAVKAANTAATEGFNKAVGNMGLTPSEASELKELIVKRHVSAETMANLHTTPDAVKILKGILSTPGNGTSSADILKIKEIDAIVAAAKEAVKLATG